MNEHLLDIFTVFALHIKSSSLVTRALGVSVVVNVRCAKGCRYLLSFQRCKFNDKSLHFYFCSFCISCFWHYSPFLLIVLLFLTIAINSMFYLWEKNEVPVGENEKICWRMWGNHFFLLKIQYSEFDLMLNLIKRWILMPL